MFRSLSPHSSSHTKSLNQKYTKQQQRLWAPFSQRLASAFGLSMSKLFLSATRNWHSFSFDQMSTWRLLLATAFSASLFLATPLTLLSLCPYFSYLLALHVQAEPRVRAYYLKFQIQSAANRPFYCVCSKAESERCPAFLQSRYDCLTHKSMWISTLIQKLVEGSGSMGNWVNCVIGIDRPPDSFAAVSAQGRDFSPFFNFNFSLCLHDLVDFYVMLIWQQSTIGNRREDRFNSTTFNVSTCNNVTLCVFFVC